MQNLTIKRFVVFIESIKKISNWTIILKVYFHRYENNNFIIKTKNDLKIKLRTKSTDLQAFANVWLLEEYKERGFEINNEDTIIDIGGHVGLFSMYASIKCKSGKIFTYEPIKENFQLMKENIQLNKLTNINIFNLGVSDKNGKKKIFLNKDSSGHSFYAKTDQWIEINTISLNDIFKTNNIEKCHFLKLDCEGAEFEILEGLNEQYFEKIEKLCLEYHIFENDSDKFQKLKRKLIKYNFSLNEKPITRNMGTLFAIKSKYL